MVLEKLGEEAERKLPDRLRVGRPDRGDLGNDRALAELARVAGVAKELTDRGGVGPSRKRPDLAVEAQLVANQPPEARPQQVRALSEEASPRIGELEAAIGGGDRHAHLRVAGLDAELPEQGGELRVVAVVVDDEAGVDPDLATRVVDADRVRVPADPLSRLEDGDVVGAVKLPRGREPGDAGADYGDL